MASGRVEGAVVFGIDKKREMRRQKGFRLPPDVADYIEERAKLSKVGETDVAIDAFTLHRALDGLMTANQKRFERYAAANGLDLRHGGHRVLEHAILAGLDAHDAKKK